MNLALTHSEMHEARGSRGEVDRGSLDDGLAKARELDA